MAPEAQLLILTAAMAGLFDELTEKEALAAIIRLAEVDADTLEYLAQRIVQNRSLGEADRVAMLALARQTLEPGAADHDADL